MTTPSTPPVKRGPGRPRKVVVAPRDDIDDLIGGPKELANNASEPLLDGLDLGLVHAGVSAAWLGHVFGHDKNTIKKKLANCLPSGVNKGTPLYRIPDAAAWLVKPKVNIAEYIRGMSRRDLPPELNSLYWDAMLKRQKWEENAGQLWRGEDVLRVFGEAAIKIKNIVQLWVDELDRVNGLPENLREQLGQMADGLLEEIHDSYVTAPQKGTTLSTVTEHEDAVTDV